MRWIIPARNASRSDAGGPAKYGSFGGSCLSVNNLMIHGRAITSYQSDNNQAFPLANPSKDNWAFRTVPYEEVAMVGLKDPRASKSPYLCPEVIRSLPNTGRACTYGMNSQLSELNI